MIFNLEFTFFYRFPGLTSSFNIENKENKLIASFLLGIAYTAIAAPCAAPIFLSLLASTIYLDPISIVLMMVVYSFGAGLPFLLIGGLYPKFNEEILLTYKKGVRYIKPFSGVIMLLISFYLLNIYVLPYYPLTYGNSIFYGIKDEFLNSIYLIILIIIILMAIILISLAYFNNRRKKYLCS